MIELDETQAAALAELEEGIQAIGAGFDRFVKGAEACEQAGLPPEIVNAKALELQGLVMGKMLGTAQPPGIPA